MSGALYSPEPCQWCGAKPTRLVTVTPGTKKKATVRAYACRVHAPRIEEQVERQEYERRRRSQ